MRIFIIKDNIQNSGNRIKFVDRGVFIQIIKSMLDENGSLGNQTFGYIDDEKALEIFELDNDTLRVILDEC